jgi:hypothetical protein
MPPYLLLADTAGSVARCPVRQWLYYVATAIARDVGLLVFSGGCSGVRLPGGWMSVVIRVGLLVKVGVDRRDRVSIYLVLLKMKRQIQ